MRIGIDARLWNETGVGRYIRNLVKELQKIDIKNEYVLFVRSQDYFTVNKNFGSKQWKIVKADIHWHSLAEQIKLPQILNKYNLDLVHFPYFSVPIKYKKPFVITIHDLILHNFPTGKASTHPLPLYKAKHIAYKYILKTAAKNAEKIITVSESTKKEIAKWLHISKEKITVTYEGFDEKIMTQDFPLSYLKKIIGTTNPYFLYVGNAYPHKNLSLLLSAFAQFKKASAATPQLVLVGKRDYFYSRLEKEILKLGFSEHVIIKNNVTNRELAILYHHAKAIVLPSLMEGFGLPALEAMASKTLVVASNISAFREICSGAAIYFDPKNEKELLNSLQFVSVHDKKYFQKNIETGYERSKLFTWKKMAEETLKVYESCVGIRSG